VLIVALCAAGIHGLVIASEEFRHLWALLGLVGLAGVPQWAQSHWWKDGRAKERGHLTTAAGDEAVPE
jgi:hypothetical protein